MNQRDRKILVLMWQCLMNAILLVISILYHNLNKSEEILEAFDRLEKFIQDANKEINKWWIN